MKKKKILLLIISIILLILVCILCMKRCGSTETSSTMEPTPSPMVTQMPAPTEEPVPEMEETATPIPEETATPKPVAKETPAPTALPTAAPTATPTPAPVSGGGWRPSFDAIPNGLTVADWAPDGETYGDLKKPVSGGNEPATISIPFDVDTLAGDLKKTLFSNGDTTTIWAWTGSPDTLPNTFQINPTKGTYDGSRWNMEQGIGFKDAGMDHYFLAISPAKTVNDLTADTFVHTPGNHKANDILVAKDVTGLSYDDDYGKFDLEYEHLMGQLVVNLHFRNQWGGIPEVSSVVVEGGYTEAEINYLTKTVTPTTKGTVTLESCTAQEYYERSFKSAMIPATGYSTLKITVEGEEYVGIVEPGFEIKQGETTVINLNVGRDEITLHNVSISDWEVQGNPIQGEAQNSLLTDGEETQFAPGAQIGIYAWTGAADEVPADRVVSGAVNTFNGTKWNAVQDMLWVDMNTEHYFLGVYPAHEITNFKADRYTIDPSNQEASDLMIAVNNGGLKAQNNPVQLTFDHAMAKLVVNLNFRDQWADTPEVESVIYEGYITAEVDYMAKNVTGKNTGDVRLNKLEGTPVVGEVSYSSIVIPGMYTKTIRICIDGEDYIYHHDTYIPLNRGKVTTINLNVGRNFSQVIDLSESTGDIVITTPTLLNGNHLTTPYTGNITINGDTTVTLLNADIARSGENQDAIVINGDVKLLLEGTNKIALSGNYTDGIRVNSGSVTIESEQSNGKLLIDGSANRCGAIVAGNGADITINSGYIEAISGAWQAGIGSGYGSVDYPQDNTACGDITVNGGTIIVQGGYYSVGIGASYNSQGGDIIINGGTVTANGGNSGAGIGTGYVGTCGNVTITGENTVITATGDDPWDNIAIGSGYQGTCGTVTIGAGVTVNGTVYQQDTIGQVPNAEP